MEQQHWYGVEFYLGTSSNPTVVREVVVAATNTAAACAKAKALCPAEAADGRLGCIARRGKKLTKAESWSERKRGDVS